MKPTLETAEDSLSLIHLMIRDKKKAMGKSAIHYLLWGTSVSVAALIHYLMLKLNIDNAPLSWPILMTLSGIIAIIVGFKESKKQQTKSWLDNASDALWLSFSISLLIGICASVVSGNWQQGYTFILCLYGLGLFVSGSILSFLPFKIGGIINWVLAVASLKLGFPEMLLIIVAAMVSGYLIPGIMLYRQERKNEV